MKWRIALALTTLVLAAVYGFVILVAMVTNGPELLRQPLTYYAIIMPFILFAFCLLTAAGRIPKRALRTSGMVIFSITLPCLVVSFLGIGLAFPVLAFLWYHVYRWQRSGGEGPA
jgi:NhaP-type Na+/H+ or K+/H+ antiporter